MNIRNTIITKNIEYLLQYEKNNKKHTKAQIDLLAKNIIEFGFNVPILIDESDIIIAGHARVLAAKKLNIKELPCILIDDLTAVQVKALRIADNRIAELAETDWEMLKSEFDDLKDLDFDTDLVGYEDEDFSDYLKTLEPEPEEDDFTPPKEAKYKIEKGDVYQLGRHKLVCGDCTIKADVDNLMAGKKADLVFTDPPYGMKKEKEGVINDNLNYQDLLDFNKIWIALSFEYLTDVGSWYCWGMDEPLMDIYSEILKPLKLSGDITFRNIITWNKGTGQGQNSEEFRMYPTADEKCLFVMKGVQGFNTNADNYYEGWEPIRQYLYDSRVEMGWDIPKMKTIAGHSDKSRDHWTSKSQWTLPTEEVYLKFQAAVRKRESKGDKEYSAFKKEYSAFKKEYDELKKEFYSTRSYFNNTHDNQNNVWSFKRESDRSWGHATPKPLVVCLRAIKSSSQEKNIVLDLFGGSGSTLIACEQTKRICYMMEIDSYYCSVIIERFEKYTNNSAIKQNG